MQAWKAWEVGVQEKKMCWAEDTAEELSLAWEAEGSHWQQLSPPIHENIYIVEAFLKLSNIYLFQKRLHCNIKKKQQ